MKLHRYTHGPAAGPEIPSRAGAVAVDAVDASLVMDGLPLEVRRSLRVFLLAAPTAELHRRRSALVRELVAHLVEDGSASIN